MTILLKIYKKLISYIKSLILQKSSEIIILIIIISTFDDLKVIQDFHYSIYNSLYKILNNIKKYYKSHR